MSMQTTIERPAAALTSGTPVQAPPAGEEPFKARPVKVQVNRTGLWHDVATFDAGSEAAEAHMRAGIEALAALDKRTSFRVVACIPLLGSAGGVLLHYCTNGGWITK